MIRSLEYHEFQALYRERIVADFPPMERRPLWIVRRLYAGKRYLCLVLEEEGATAAYATFIWDDNLDSVLLDYFAVDKNRRGSGTGSLFLSMLGDYWPGKGGILLECERPESADDPMERQLRQRRVDFYLRGGAQRIGLRWRAFGVDYSVLWLPVRQSVQGADPARDLWALYTLSMPSLLASLFLKVQFDDKEA